MTNRCVINEDRLVRLFLDLCGINSPALAEKDVVAWTKSYLETEGLEVHEDDAGAKLGGNGNNLIAWLRGDKPEAPKVFLSAHFDTVEPTEGLIIGDMNGTFYSESDTILGADDKGGMAPAIEAVLALKESGESHGDICLLLSVAEEIGLKGAEVLDLSTLDLDFGYVLDTSPPVGSFVIRTATHDKLDIVVKGKPSHAGKDPENGISAIQVAAIAISGMNLGRIGPETTANLGLIEGGSAVNVVPAITRIRGEARSTSVEELDKQVAHMVTRFEEAASRFGAKVEIEHRRHYSSYHIQPEERVVQIAVAAAKNLGLSGTLRTTLGGSDANIYNAKGLPCIVVATGMEHIHTHEECISREDLVLTAKLALELLLNANRT